MKWETGNRPAGATAATRRRPGRGVLPGMRGALLDDPGGSRRPGWDGGSGGLGMGSLLVAPRASGAGWRRRAARGPRRGQEADGDRRPFAEVDGDVHAVWRPRAGCVADPAEELHRSRCRRARVLPEDDLRLRARLGHARGSGRERVRNCDVRLRHRPIVTGAVDPDGNVDIRRLILNCRRLILPIYSRRVYGIVTTLRAAEIGRASCRERVLNVVDGGATMCIVI